MSEQCRCIPDPSYRESCDYCLETGGPLKEQQRPKGIDRDENDDRALAETTESEWENDGGSV